MIETVEIKHVDAKMAKKGETMVINASDFDESKHELAVTDEEAKKKEEAEAKKAVAAAKKKEEAEAKKAVAKND